MESATPKPNRARFSLVTLGIVFCLNGLVLYLLFNNYQSAKQLQQAYFSGLAEELHRRATPVDFFLTECRNDLTTLGDSREVGAHFQNIDLEMSPAYGLNLSLAGIHKLFQDLSAKQLANGIHWYQRILLLDDQGNIMVEVGGPNATNRPNANYAGLLDPKLATPAILFEQRGAQIRLSVSYAHNGKFRGQIIAWLASDALMAQLQDQGDRERHKLFIVADQTCLFPPPVTTEPPFSEAAFQFHPAIPWDHTRVMGPSQGKPQVPYEVFRVPLNKNPPLELVSAFNVADSSLALSPYRFIGAMTLLSTLVLGGSFWLLHFDRKSLTLKVRLDEDVRRRQEAEEKTRHLMIEVGERRKAEVALKQSEQNYREIFNATQDAIFIHEAGSGKILDVNQAMLDMYDYTREEIGLLNLEALSANEPGYCLSDAQNNLLKARTHNPQLIEWKARRKNGAVFWVEVALKSSSIGGQGRVLAVVRDITERKLAEIQQQSLQSQLAQAQKMESVGRLAGGVAHDFNNLLTSILGNLEMTIADLPAADQEFRENLLEAQKAGERASELTRQLLAFSRKQILQVRSVDVNQLVVGFGKMLQRLIGEDIEFVTTLNSSVGKIKADPAQIEQVILNLAINARDAMPNGGKLVIKTANASLDAAYASTHPESTAGSYVLLEVCDTGCGMTAETQKNIFEPFFTTKPVGEGTGLGLATVYGIVKQHAGHVTVNSELGRGTTFSIYLPRSREAEEALDVSPQPKRALPGTETILVVEDDTAVRQLTGRLLSRNGYQVLLAASGNEAIAQVKKNGKIDLLITDVIMPQMSGQAVYEAINQLQPGVKVLFCSGYTTDIIAKHNVLPEGIHFLQKPFSIHALTAKLREILDHD